LVVVALVSLLSVASPSSASDSLYDALGQQGGISSIVRSLLVRLHADPRTREYFDGVSDKRLQDKLSEQFCQLADGPCTYTGHTMKQAHGGLHINRAAFNALVEDLQDAMDEYGVAPAAQNRLLAKLAPMSRDVEQP
jgi:hemoglobin